MIKETKNIITKETCKKDLMNSAKTTFFAMLFLLPLILLLAIFLIIGGISVMEYIFLGIISIALAAFISFCFIFALINRFLVLNLIKKNEFSIVKDTVCRISKGELVSRNRTANVIYFTKFGRHIPSQTVFDLTSIDDEFYIVVIHTKEKEPALFFHSMMYECKELDK